MKKIFTETLIIIFSVSHKSVFVQSDLFFFLTNTTYNFHYYHVSVLVNKQSKEKTLRQDYLVED